jgi:arylsulfatase A-like enzyme
MGLQKQPNILLVVCDTLGAKHMSLYGYKRRTTPFLDRISLDDGFSVYSRCFSPAAWTIPSHVSFLSGLYPHEHGIDGENLFFSDQIRSLPELLRQLGYRTCAISCNALVSGLLNFQRGFDEFHEMWHLFHEQAFFEINRILGRSKKEVHGEFQRFKMLMRVVSEHGAFDFVIKKFLDNIYKKVYGIQAMLRSSVYTTNRALKTARDFIARRDDHKPFFLFLNIMETHNQYNPPKDMKEFGRVSESVREEVLKKYEWHHYVESPFDDETFEALNVLYDREVLYLDRVLHDFYLFAKEQKVLDDTMLIITSDHGELIGEHGHFNHIFSLYNELLHVPLLIRYPRRFGMTGFQKGLVQLHDIFATISEVAGSPFPVPESSKSLVSERRDAAIAESLTCDRALAKFRQKSSSFTVHDFMLPHRALITNDFFKLILRADGHMELYDLNNDFDERYDLSSQTAHAARIQRMLHELGAAGCGDTV